MKKILVLLGLSISCLALFAEVAEFGVPSSKNKLKNMKAGAATVAITQGTGSTAPNVEDIEYISFYPGNEMAVSVAEGYVINKITLGTTDRVFMQHISLSSGSIVEELDFIWTSDSPVTNMTLTNGSDDPTGKGFKYTQIASIKVEYDVPSAEQMTPVVCDDDVSVLANGDLQVKFKLLRSDYELYYKHVSQSRADEASDGFVAAEGNGIERIVTLSSPGALTYYVYDPASQVRGAQRVAAINGDGSAGVLDCLETIGSGVSAIYDLQGRRVVAPNRGRIYIKGGRKFMCVE